MVTCLVWLKWRLLVNGLRHDRQRLIGFPILLAFVAFGSFALAARYMDAAETLQGTALAEFSLWASLTIWVGWMTLPVLLFPLDETLSPAKFALQPISTRSLVAGLTAAGIVTPPIVVPLVLIAQAVGELGLEGAFLSHTLSPISWLLPPVAAQQAIVHSAQGRTLAALGALAAAAVWVIVIGWVWARVVSWLITTPEAPVRMSRTTSQGLLVRARWSTVSAIAAKELRFYFRDPRMRMVWTGGVVFLGIIAASLMVGSAQLDIVRESPWITLTAPAIVLFVGLPIALNQYGWERNAASFLFALPVTAKQLMLGKNIASATALAVEAIVLSLLFAAVSSGWSMLVFAPFLIATAILCQLAIGNVVSVLTPMRLPPVGTDLFAQATEQGCLALVSQMGAFAVIGLLMVPPAAAFALMANFGVDALRFRIGFTLGSLVWGLTLYLIGLWLGTRILERRLPELVTAVQTV